MSSTESRLMWVAIALSLLLVLALGTLAVYSVIGRDDAEQADDQIQAADSVPEDESPAAPNIALPIVDLDRPISVHCVPSEGQGQGQAYTVAITNRSSATVDYVVSIELSLSNAGSIITSAEIPSLEPGEQREVIVNAAGSSGRQITGCSIAAVQSDRRVLLANS